MWSLKKLCALLFSIAVLHDLLVKETDALNAYVMAFNREMTWTVLGPEFWDNGCKSAIIVRVLYGLESVGDSF